MQLSLPFEMAAPAEAARLKKKVHVVSQQAGRCYAEHAGILLAAVACHFQNCNSGLSLQHLSTCSWGLSLQYFLAHVVCA